MSAKRRDIKVVFRYSEGIDQPIVTPQLPMVFDLQSDPGKSINCSPPSSTWAGCTCPR
jgi:hypothetical protein